MPALTRESAMDSLARKGGTGHGPREWAGSEAAPGAAGQQGVHETGRRGLQAHGATLALVRRAAASRRVQVSGGLLLVLVAIAILAPALSPYDPLQMNPPARMRPPGAGYLLGTDEYGRDVLSRIVWGARISLGVGAAAVALAAAGGVSLGLLAGYFGGLVDSLIMRLMDVVLCFPPILLGIAVVGFAGRSFVNLILVLGLLFIPRFARVIYGSVQSVKQNQYVEAARAVGGGHVYIMRKDILPNIFAIILIQITLNFGFMILLEAGLSFLGLGTVPPTPSWGTMIASARDYMEIAPFLVVWPSLAVALTVLSFNLLGDGLRDALDPRLREG
jgi:ABC-type dipeptide/oligopeptide/nickel transport system permease subunit